jgi:hypothetical protein
MVMAMMPTRLDTRSSRHGNGPEGNTVHRSSRNDTSSQVQERLHGIPEGMMLVSKEQAIVPEGGSQKSKQNELSRRNIKQSRRTKQTGAGRFRAGPKIGSKETYDDLVLVPKALMQIHGNRMHQHTL